MKKHLLLCVTMFCCGWLLICPAHVLQAAAASATGTIMEQAMGNQTGGLPSESQNALGQTDTSGRSQLSSSSSDDKFIKFLEENDPSEKSSANNTAGSSNQQDTSGFFPPEKDAEKRSSFFSPQKKMAVILKAEPGDGLVKLSWRAVNFSPQALEQQVRFVVRYGIESKKPIRTIQLGSLDNYVLRGLTNLQPHFIDVVALNREQQTIVKSEEMRVTPLPAEEAGSRIEKSFARKNLTLMDKFDPEPFRRELKQFGYEFFRNSLQLTSVVDTLPAGADYLLGPGDALQLSVWGAVNARYELVIDRNGEIVIPKVGSVRVWGLTIDQAKTEVNTAISRYFRNYEFNLTLGKLRSIQVFIVGEVETPGSYPISSLATVINALASAGGPTLNGSLRKIQVSRGDKLVGQVDLYDMLLSGDRSKDMRLQSGDTIFVPIIGPVAAVAGEVRRPSIYELKGRTTLPELIAMAGGIAASGYKGRIQVERMADNRSRIALDYEPNGGTLEASLAAVEVQDRDMVKVFPMQDAMRQIVSLKGNVVRPGEYQLRTGMRLADLIPSSQELLPESYLDSVEITRLTPPDYRRELITVSLRRALSGSEADNVLLQEQDTVKVFSRWEMEERPRVAVNGAVMNPGAYDYYPGMSVRDLVTAAGSPKRFAYLERAELSRIAISNEKARSSRVQLDLGKALAGDPAHNLALQSDDVLIVRSVTDWIDATDKFVRLKGEVRFPGVYSVARGEKLSEVIARAGGFTDKAYLKGARFLRRSVREIQQKRMDEIIFRTEKDIMQKQAAVSTTATSREEIEGTRSSLDAMMKHLEKLKGMKAEGRIVISLKPLEELPKTSYDLDLEGGDELEIPPRPSAVNVLGQVYNPTSFVYLQEKPDINAYLQLAGGATNDAEQSEMYVIRADGSVYSRQQSSFGIKWSDEGRRWQFGSFLSTALEPGDTLVVPQKIERIAWMREIKDLTQILANVALTAGTVLIGLK